MKITAVKTQKVLASQLTIEKLLDEYLGNLAGNTVVAITSKVVGLCEGRVIPIGSIKKDELIKRESDYFLDSKLSKYGLSFTITKGTLVPVAGIDESNGNGNYVLWPQNPQKSANMLRLYLKNKHKLNNVGVVITDSTARPMHFGTEGVAIAYSGFSPLNDYVGQPDLFGRPYKASVSNIADSLAAAAVVVMGEGTEQTPLALIEDLPFVKFQDRDPSQKELTGFYLSHMDDDLFAPFLKNAPWQRGSKKG